MTRQVENSIRPMLASIAATQRMMGVGRSKIYELIGAGELKIRKIGRRTLVKIESIEEFIESRH